MSTSGVWDDLTQIWLLTVFIWVFLKYCWIFCIYFFSLFWLLPFSERVTMMWNDGQPPAEHLQSALVLPNFNTKITRRGDLPKFRKETLNCYFQVKRCPVSIANCCCFFSPPSCQRTATSSDISVASVSSKWLWWRTRRSHHETCPRPLSLSVVPGRPEEMTLSVQRHRSSAEEIE